MSDDCMQLLFALTSILLVQKRAEIVIPPKSNRIIRRKYDVERLFNKLKNFRRIATGYDKTACGIHGGYTSCKHSHLAEIIC
jgi:transposase